MMIREDKELIKSMPKSIPTINTSLCVKPIKIERKRKEIGKSKLSSGRKRRRLLPVVSPIVRLRGRELTLRTEKRNSIKTINGHFAL
jgi:hypothetical protein